MSEEAHAESPKKKTPKRANKPVKYCKAPQAPKRFKSAFIFFTMDRHKTIRKKVEEDKGKGDRTPDVAKIISEEWRNLSPAERAVWDEKARLDKERYEVEKQMYTGPWKIPAKSKSRKDPAAPKRPMSSFLSFSNSKRGDLKRKNPALTNAEASKMLAQMWRDAPEEEKREHIEREERLREVYKVEIAAWRERTHREAEEKREKREEVAKNIIAKRAKVYGSRDQDYYAQFADEQYAPYAGHPSYQTYPPYPMYGYAPQYGPPQPYPYPVPGASARHQDDERLPQPPPPPPGYYYPGSSGSGRYHPPSYPGYPSAQRGRFSAPGGRFESEQGYYQQQEQYAPTSYGDRNEGRQESSQQQATSYDQSGGGGGSKCQDQFADVPEGT